MTYYSTITSKGQLTLPADIRAKLHIKPGQKVAIHLNEKGEAVIEPTVTIEELRKKAWQSLHDRGLTDDQVREIGRRYKSGDGQIAAIEEEYGLR